MFSKEISTIGLLALSNVFMTLAWYGHLKFSQQPGFQKLGIVSIILMSWGVAFFEYCCQVPANKIGFQGNGGPFTLLQLKIIQEVLTLFIFLIFSTVFFQQETLRWNHLFGMILLVSSVYFIFKK